MEAADPVVAAVRERLAARRPGAAKDDAAALAAFYAEHKGHPVGPGGRALGARLGGRGRDAQGRGVGPRGERLRTAAACRGRAGRALAEAEVTIAFAVLKYARHARGGRTDPSSLSRYIDRKPPLREPRTVLTEIAAASAPDAYLRDLHPKHAQFQRLRQVLLKQGMASSEDAAERPVEAPRRTSAEAGHAASARRAPAPAPCHRGDG